MPNLISSMKELYGEQLTDGEAYIVGNNLIKFFSLLHEIDSRVKREAQISLNKQSNEIIENYADNRSAN